MKILLSIFLLCISYVISAQAFGTQGTWHFEYREFGYQYIYEVAYEKDSTINGNTYQALAATGLQYLRTGLNSSQTNTARKRYFFLRTVNDTVYRLDTNGNDYILYDFNAQVGDSWVIGPTDTMLKCSTTPTVEVHATGVDTVNGVALNFWQVSSTSSTSHWIFPAGKIYERIGFICGRGCDLLFAPVWQNCDPTVVVSPEHRTMRCYQDPLLGFVNRMPKGNNCDSVEAVSNPEVQHTAISIFPNPSNGSFKVESTASVFDEILIFDSSGQLVRKIETDAINALSLTPNLPEGIYLLVIRKNGKRIAASRLMIQN